MVLDAALSSRASAEGEKRKMPPLPRLHVLTPALHPVCNSSGELFGYGSLSESLSASSPASSSAHRSRSSAFSGDKTREAIAGEDPGEAAIEAVLCAGAPCLQLRCKHGTDAARFALAHLLRQQCVAHEAVFIVNDRVDIAMATDAHGVHVGAQDLPVAVVRRLVGVGRLVGGTCRDADTARRLEDSGADYLGVGPVYASFTKAGLPPPLGLDGLQKVAAAVDIPVIGIAGITPARVPEVLAAGAYGVAVIGAVFSPVPRAGREPDESSTAGTVEAVPDALGRLEQTATVTRAFLHALAQALGEKSR